MSSTKTLKAYNDLFSTFFLKEGKKKLVKTVAIYAGEFDDKEVGAKSYTSPAIFTSFLGSRELNKEESQSFSATDYRMTRFVSVVIVKQANSREARKLVAMEIADLLEKLLSSANKQSCDVNKASKIIIENSYNREIDKTKQARFVVSWWTPILKLTEPDPKCYDWLTVEHNVDKTGPESLINVSDAANEITNANTEDNS